jgi:hypothetical protein
MGRPEPNPAGGCHPLSFLGIASPALEEDRPDHGSSHRPAHLLPPDWRPGVKKQPLFEGWDHRRRRCDPDQPGLDCEQAPYGEAICAIHLRVREQSGEEHPGHSVTLERRPPRGAHNWHPGRGEWRSEASEPHVDDAEPVAQKVVL